MKRGKQYKKLNLYISYIKTAWNGSNVKQTMLAGADWHHLVWYDTSIYYSNKMVKIY